MCSTSDVSLRSFLQGGELTGYMCSRKRYYLCIFVVIGAGAGFMLMAFGPFQTLFQKTEPVTLQYGVSPRQSLDLYLPDERAEGASAPVLVFLYGGSWNSGTRGLYRFIGRAFADAGYVVAIPDYRLYPEVQYPAFVRDCAEAIAWVEKNVAAHGGDPSRMAVMGHSAGAHMGALIATNPMFREQAGFSEDAIRGFVGLAGPYTFNPLNVDSTKDAFATAPEAPKGLDGARPIKMADSLSRSDAPPMLLLHGARDETVLERNTSEFAAKLRDQGIPVTTKTYALFGHVGLVAVLAWPLRPFFPVYDDVTAFLQSLE